MVFLNATWMHMLTCWMGLFYRESSVPVDMKPLPKEPDDDRRKKQKTPKGKIYKLSEKPIISPPSNFEHTVHVGFDSQTGEFTGMPESWAKLLQNSNISKLEQKKNPQAVLDVLNYYDASSKEQKESKYMTSIAKSSSLNNTKPLTDRFATGAVITPQQPPAKQERSTPPTPEEEEEAPPPPIAARPEKTKSIYTKPIEPDEKPNGAVPIKTERPKKKKVPTATLR